MPGPRPLPSSELSLLELGLPLNPWDVSGLGREVATWRARQGRGGAREFTPSAGEHLTTGSSCSSSRAVCWCLSLSLSPGSSPRRTNCSSRSSGDRGPTPAPQAVPCRQPERHKTVISLKGSPSTTVHNEAAKTYRTYKTTVGNDPVVMTIIGLHFASKS